MAQPTWSFLTAADPRGEAPWFFSVWWGSTLENQVRVQKGHADLGKQNTGPAGMWSTGLRIGDGHYLWAPFVWQPGLLFPPAWEETL